MKKENKVLTKALKDLTTAYVKVVDLFEAYDGKSRTKTQGG